MNNNGNGNLNGSLPISDKRRKSNIIYEAVSVAEGKVFSIPNQNNDVFKQQITLKAMEAIPDLLNLAKSYMELKKTAGQAEAQVKMIREHGENLQKQADAFVKTEIARRNSFATKSEAVKDVLNDLYGSLNTLQSSDELKKELISLVNRSIQGLLGGKASGNE